MSFFILTAFFNIAAGASDWYESNRIGMPLTPISFSERERYEWILMKEMRGAEDVTILFHNLKEEKKWVLSVDENGRNVRSYYEFGILKETEILNSSGQTEELSEFLPDGRLDKRRVCYYIGNRLSSVEIFDSESRKLYDDIYILREDGSLHSFQRFFQPEPDEQQENAAAAEANGDSDVIIQTWQAGESGYLLGVTIVRNGVLKIERYNKSGLLTEKDFFEGKINTLSVRYFYNPDGKTDHVVEENFLEQTKREKKYNPSGFVETETLYKDDIIVSLDNYSYNEDGKVVRLERRGAGEKWLFLYQYEEGILSVETRYLDGNLHSRIFYDDESGENRREDLYKNNDLFLTAYYAGDRKTKEEFYRDGVLLRTREYQ